MVATAILLPRLFPATVTPRSPVRTTFAKSVEHRTAANLFVGAGGVLTVLGGRTPAAGSRRRAKSNPPVGIPIADASVQQGAAGVRNVSAVRVPLDCDGCLDADETSQRICKIKGMLGSMGDGEISVSAYDTAWVALVPDLRGHGASPQFPSSLQWIEENQLPDGSWGDPDVFLAYDRLLNTLACVIALRTWGVCPDGCQRGISFLRENMHRLEGEEAEQMTCGFEMTFPSLVEVAGSLDLGILYDEPALQDIYARRALKLERIPKDMVHRVPTTLLHSLEGMAGLDWEKLLRLQCTDGSFLCSPASTAFALMQTRDSKCLSYLEQIVRRFNGAPNVYPIDLFERMWAVDRLERLGISRYFKEEIGKCLDYVYRRWREAGIGWARTSTVPDVDDTSMGFRLLRSHGYDVSADVFRHFEKVGEFFCFAGESNQAITGIYNLNRASQVSFPGEKVLEEARTFSHRFLREKQSRNEVSDKWIITKDLPGEVGYGLDFPWYASLPRVETRFYLEQYGGDRDVWIGKTLYRMPYVNNDDYLELARSDFSRWQALHRVELLGLRRWYEECGLRWFGVRRRSLVTAYFLAAASIFEPERAAERVGWAQMTVLAEAVSVGGDSYVMDEMTQALRTRDDSACATTILAARRPEQDRTVRGLVRVLLHTLDRLSSDSVASSSPGDAQVAAAQRRIRELLQRAWEDWILARREQEDDASHVSGWWPGGTKNDETGLLLVRSVELCAGHTGLEESLQTKQYASLTGLISSLCRKLRHLRRRNLSTAAGDKRNDNGEGDGGAVNSQDIESDMLELIECVLRNPNGGSRSTLQTFLTVAKSFYYVASCPPSTLEHHIAMVLFEGPV